jgi:hypothetical protein
VWLFPLSEPDLEGGRVAAREFPQCNETQMPDGHVPALTRRWRGVGYLEWWADKGKSLGFYIWMKLRQPQKKSWLLPDPFSRSKYFGLPRPAWKANVGTSTDTIANSLPELCRFCQPSQNLCLPVVFVTSAVGFTRREAPLAYDVLRLLRKIIVRVRRWSWLLHRSNVLCALGRRLVYLFG